MKFNSKAYDKLYPRNSDKDIIKEALAEDSMLTEDEEVKEAAKAMSGMENIGATCYFNATWQMLVNNPVFFAHCLKIAKDAELRKKLINYQTFQPEDGHKKSQLLKTEQIKAQVKEVKRPGRPKKNK